MSSGTLTVVGTGIQLGQMSIQASSFIKESDKVLYLVTDPVTSDWIEENSKDCEPLNDLYSTDKDRLTSYLEMVERIMKHVRNGLHVCAVFYGHPGVFVLPSHEAIRRARQEGYQAVMLPGVSAEDCLFSDLGIDPATSGCQSFEATDFLVHRRRFDPNSHLIIWQIGVIGDIGYKERYGLEGLRVLVDVLGQEYGLEHEVVVYEAARYVVCDPSIRRIPLGRLADIEISPISTLYVAPKQDPVPDLDMIQRLGIPMSYIKRKHEVILGGRVPSAV